MNQLTPSERLCNIVESTSSSRYDFFEDEDEDELDAAIRRRDAWRRAQRADLGAGPIPGDEDDDYEASARNIFRFPWDEDESTPGSERRPEQAPQKKYSGGQELTGFWRWLRDAYDQVFWYDIDFEEEPYQPRQRFTEIEEVPEGRRRSAGAYRPEPRARRQSFGGGPVTKSPPGGSSPPPPPGRRRRPPVGPSSRSSQTAAPSRQWRQQQQQQQQQPWTDEEEEDDVEWAGRLRAQGRRQSQGLNADTENLGQGTDGGGVGGLDTPSRRRRLLRPNGSGRRLGEGPTTSQARATPEVAWRPAKRQRPEEDDEGSWGSRRFRADDDLDNDDGKEWSTEFGLEEGEDDDDDEELRSKRGRGEGTVRAPSRRRLNAAAAMNALQSKVDLVEAEVKAIQDRLGTVNEKLSVLRVSSALWSKRLEEALAAESRVVECEGRLDAIAEQQRRGELAKQSLEEDMEDRRELLADLRLRMGAMKQKLDNPGAASAAAAEAGQEEDEERSSPISRSSDPGDSSSVREVEVVGVAGDQEEAKVGEEEAAGRGTQGDVEFVIEQPQMLQLPVKDKGKAL